MIGWMLNRGSNLLPVKVRMIGITHVFWVTKLLIIIILLRRTDFGNEDSTTLMLTNNRSMLTKSF